MTQKKEHSILNSILKSRLLLKAKEKYPPFTLYKYNYRTKKGNLRFYYHCFAEYEIRTYYNNNECISAILDTFKKDYEIGISGFDYNDKVPKAIIETGTTHGIKEWLTRV